MRRRRRRPRPNAPYCVPRLPRRRRRPRPNAPPNAPQRVPRLHQGALRENLAVVGLSESDLAGVESPVLVRERITEVDRAAFAREANAPPVLQMSTLEVALVDSQRISGELVGLLAVREGQSIDQALRTKANAEFVRGFIGTLSENESALLQRKDGTLAQARIRRIKAALFVRTFQGEAGERLADVFLEALDSDIKNFETAISSSLPVLARVEQRIASGERSAVLSMTEDFSNAMHSSSVHGSNFGSWPSSTRSALSRSISAFISAAYRVSTASSCGLNQISTCIRLTFVSIPDFLLTRVWAQGEYIF